MGVETLKEVYPRVRGGTELGVANRHIERGSIPACAGEPEFAIFGRVGRGVYPRVRGGTRAGKSLERHAHGLSPRARGNLQRYQLVRLKHRSIPACAGEPFKKRAGRLEAPVYPRVRGGTERAQCPRWFPYGLSPRARGNRRRDVLLRARHGSIPACAGEPVLVSGSASGDQVYPRVRGGTGSCS